MTYVEVGQKAVLNDGSTVIVIEVASPYMFIGKQENGVTGIFYARQIKSIK